MAKNRKFRLRKVKHAPAGSAPGLINIPADAGKPQILTFHYNESGCFEEQASSIEEMDKLLVKYENFTHWFDITGFGDKLFFEKLAERFELHRLEMEDVFAVYQRPKVEQYPGHIFCISRILWDTENGISNDQLSLFLIGQDIVITIHDFTYDPFQTVKERIRKKKGYMQTERAGYLAYALIDTAIDLYYPIIEKTGDRLDQLEDELVTDPKKEHLNHILEIKRMLIPVRRVIWQERDKVNDIIRSDFVLFNQNTKVYFRDVYDHCIQVIDQVDSYKEIISSLMDVYMSSVSNKLNSVMKVLTILSSIFIPLTFITGLYGMNFAYSNPLTGEILKRNMPELYSPYGYMTVLMIMATLVVLQLVVYLKAGWITFKRKQ
ncbi:MAG: magnesium/cobalt transporter CorA [Bacteroidia bacterium]|nr:magnesium/cobalt transporter CorA [Bacteroidia bacterium]MCZ2277395.1 magnesium/cobalt transporter CorA [Bacteroidia bacterium]